MLQEGEWLSIPLLPGEEMKAKETAEECEQLVMYAWKLDNSIAIKQGREN